MQIALLSLSGQRHFSSFCSFDRPPQLLRLGVSQQLKALVMSPSQKFVCDVGPVQQTSLTLSVERRLTTSSIVVNPTICLAGVSNDQRKVSAKCTVRGCSEWKIEPGPRSKSTVMLWYVPLEYTYHMLVSNADQSATLDSRLQSAQ